jgi:hypothetical protein
MNRRDAATSTASEVRAALDRTPPSGRDALLRARLHLLSGNASDDARDLLVDLAEGRIEGVSPATFSHLAGILHPSVRMRSVGLLAGTRLFATRHICEQLHWRDALPLFADLRDGRLASGLHLSFIEELPSLAALFATGNEHALRETSHTVHRRRGEETVFLLGAARSPGAFLREVRMVNVLTWPAPNDDESLAAWALANPALTGAARDFCLENNAPHVLSALRGKGVLGSGEIFRWFRTQRGVRLDRIVSALSLPDEVFGVRNFRRVALSACRNVAEVGGMLSEDLRRRLALDLAGGDATIRETVHALLTEWEGTATTLRETAFRLTDIPPEETYSR